MSQLESRARRYSEAQLDALATLGLVPWVRRDVGATDSENPIDAAIVMAPGSLPTPAPGAAEASRVPKYAAVSSEPVLVDSPPAESAALGDWLATCPLAGFARRGERRFDTGPDDAVLLVVSESASDERALMPLEAAEDTMLAAMMRSIALAPGDYSTAVVLRPGEPAEDAAPSVSRRLVGSCRALVWLSRDSVAMSGEPDAHRLRVAGVPAFRLPHPALLLADPIIKRQAWQVLKALRGVLSAA